jgi:glycosyltransferase involved in cell wall biosynthesis
VILDVDDVESVIHADLGDPEEAARFAALERWYAPRLDALLACSSPDAALLEGWGARSCTVVPNAVRWPSPAGAAEPRHDLLFVGNLSYGPNVAGVRWLCEQVLPLLPGVRVAIVGSRPGAEVLALADGERVTVAGDVPEVGPWYAGARIAVVPLHAGGGTRIKVLEAFAHQRPVVSTAVGVAGLELEDVLVADTPAAFAGACRRLLEDPSLAERTARRGERAVRESLSVEAVAARIEALARAMLRA